MLVVYEILNKICSMYFVNPLKLPNTPFDAFLQNIRVHSCNSVNTRFAKKVFIPLKTRSCTEKLLCCKFFRKTTPNAAKSGVKFALIT